MPTGYTALIEDGKVTTPLQFLQACLRNFGICWSMRDSDVEMTEEDIEPYIRKGYDDSISYHLNKLNEARDRLASLKTLTDSELYEKYAAQVQEKHDDYMQYYANAVQKNDTYEKFLDKIKAWNASEDFQNIKRFAIEQIEMSMDKDPAYWAEQANKVGLPSKEKWKENRDTFIAELVAPIQSEINYHQDEYNRKVKGKERALDFYRRFKEEIKTLDV